MPTSSRVAPRRTPRQVRSAETLDRILDAAAQVFSRRGYAAGTTNHIAAEASMSIGSLYQYFPNKDAILLALARRHMDETTGHLRECFARIDSGDIAAAVNELVDTMVTDHAADAQLHEVLFEQAPRPPELVAELEVLEQEMVAAVSSLLRQAAADSALAPGHFDDAARITVATVESLVHRMVATRHQLMDIGRFRDELVTMVSLYLGNVLTPT